MNLWTGTEADSIDNLLEPARRVVPPDDDGLELLVEDDVAAPRDRGEDGDADLTDLLLRGMVEIITDDAGPRPATPHELRVFREAKRACSAGTCDHLNCGVYA